MMTEWTVALGIIAVLLMWAAILAVISYRRHMPTAEVADGREWD